MTRPVLAAATGALLGALSALTLLAPALWPTLIDADPQRVRGAVTVATAVIAGADPLDAAIATGTSAAKATAATSVLVAAAQAGAAATQPTEGDTP